MILKDLTISSMYNPLGIDKKPYFSYVLTSEKQNVKQESYSISVCTDGKLVWKSSEKSEQSAFILYDGELKSKTRYDVEVTVRDNYGEEDTISGFFETAFLEKSDWKASWVKSGLPVFEAEKGFGKQPPATVFSKKFNCGNEIKSARLYCTCHGIYISYLNGKRFSEAEFSPEHSTYDKVLFYQCYDISGFLKKGENIFSMYVGDGWYLGVKTRPRSEKYERVHAALFQIEIELVSGEKQTVCSDNNVVCAYGKVVSSDLFAGELYNDNLDFDNFVKAETSDYGFDNLTAQIGEQVYCCDSISVKEIITTPKGETVLDFGKVLAGKISACINEKKGKEITFTHTEILDKNGNFFQSAKMPDGGVEQKDVFISGGVKKLYKPLFTYHGFRYVKIEGVSNINKDDFIANVYTTKKRNLGSFNCSDERLNKLYQNIRNSQRSNTVSIPTDCPQREKAGWTGDIAMYAQTMLLNEDVTAFLERWLLSVQADQGENGAVPIVVPYDGGYPMSEMFFGAMFEETGTIGSSGWGDACVLVPWSM